MFLLVFKFRCIFNYMFVFFFCLCIFSYISIYSLHTQHERCEKLGRNPNWRVVIVNMYVISYYAVINLVYKNECMFVLYRWLNGWTDFLEIFTVSSSMSGRSYVVISTGLGATPTYITYYSKLIRKWVYWKNYNSKIPQILYK